MSVRTSALPRSRPRLTARAAILAALVALVALAAIVPVRQMLAQGDRIAELERQAQLVADANRELEHEVARLRDPAQMERLARECLGMVHPGETAFVVVPKQGSPQPADC